MSSDGSVRIAFALQHPGFSMKLDLTVPGRGVTALFGRSGSGKTSCLRVVAGLQAAQQVHVQVGDEVWQDDAQGICLPTHRRPLGYVFQEASLFPHLSVRDNLEYGMRRVPAAERRVQLAQVVQWLGLSTLVDRRPEGLSGGERQRVAIGRALLASPRLLLMDEPLSALDLASRAAILPYLQRLHAELSIPVLYVSHAIDEVARLADHTVVLDAGRVVASGPTARVLNEAGDVLPLGEENGVLIEAAVGLHDEAYHLTRLDFAGGHLWVSRVDRPLGGAVRARVLARDVSVALSQAGDSSIANLLPARVLRMQEEGADRVLLSLETGGGTPLLARITRRSRDQLGLAPGMAVIAQVKSVALAA
ncbi:molybdenum ABC transporter ATP-binding protein [Uliginosibacterium sp. H1]|uniref:molybdenum ABC transporter ATP-binding protein n=1 Tax=Uliginosibacterium sp. H1 TaxID=3114757 RepID=UPI002E17931A|nr:molybdenum ABC transporter ATP-binding protein [Uliginosibacterium sp. H1]